MLQKPHFNNKLKFEEIKTFTAWKVAKVARYMCVYFPQNSKFGVNELFIDVEVTQILNDVAKSRLPKMFENYKILA